MKREAGWSKENTRYAKKDDAIGGCFSYRPRSRDSLCAILVLTLCCLLLPNHVQAGNNESIRFSNKGNVFKMRFVGTALGPKGEVMLEGQGRDMTVVEDNVVVVSSLVVAEINGTNIKIEAEDGPLSFSITPETRCCSSGKIVKSEYFKIGDKVIISSKEDQDVALSIQNGPIYYSLSQGGSKLVYNDCPLIQKTSTREASNKETKAKGKKTTK